MHNGNLTTFVEVHTPPLRIEKCDGMLTQVKVSPDSVFENVQPQAESANHRNLSILAGAIIRRSSMLVLCASNTYNATSAALNPCLLLVAHDKNRISVVQLNLLLGQVYGSSRRKLSPKKLAAIIFLFRVMTMTHNPLNDELIAVCGLKECHVLSLARTGFVTGHYSLMMTLDTNNYIIKALWLPNSQTELAIVTIEFIKIYDLSREDRDSPLYNFVIPSRKIRNMTFYTHEDSGILRRFALIFSSRGQINAQELTFDAMCDRERERMLFVSYFSGESFCAPFSMINIFQQMINSVTSLELGARLTVSPATFSAAAPASLRVNFEPLIEGVAVRDPNAPDPNAAATGGQQTYVDQPSTAFGVTRAMVNGSSSADRNAASTGGPKSPFPKLRLLLYLPTINEKDAVCSNAALSTSSQYQGIFVLNRLVANCLDVLESSFSFFKSLAEYHQPPPSGAIATARDAESSVMAKAARDLLHSSEYQAKADTALSIASKLLVISMSDRLDRSVCMLLARLLLSRAAYDEHRDEVIFESSVETMKHLAFDDIIVYYYNLALFRKMVTERPRNFVRFVGKYFGSSACAEQAGVADVKSLSASDLAGAFMQFSAYLSELFWRLYSQRPLNELLAPVTKVSLYENLETMVDSLVYLFYASMLASLTVSPDEAAEESKIGASYTLYGPVTALAVDGVTFLAVGKSAHWCARRAWRSLVSGRSRFAFRFSPLSLALETSPTTVVSSLVQQKSELAPRANLSVSHYHFSILVSSISSLFAARVRISSPFPSPHFLSIPSLSLAHTTMEPVPSTSQGGGQDGREAQLPSPKRQKMAATAAAIPPANAEALLLAAPAAAEYMETIFSDDCLLLVFRLVDMVDLLQTLPLVCTRWNRLARTARLARAVLQVHAGMVEPLNIADPQRRQGIFGGPAVVEEGGAGHHNEAQAQPEQLNNAAVDDDHDHHRVENHVSSIRPIREFYFCERACLKLATLLPNIRTLVLSVDHLALETSMPAILTLLNRHITFAGRLTTFRFLLRFHLANTLLAVSGRTALMAALNTLKAGEMREAFDQRRTAYVRAALAIRDIVAAVNQMDRLEDLHLAFWHYCLLPLEVGNPTLTRTMEEPLHLPVLRRLRRFFFYSYDANVAVLPSLQQQHTGLDHPLPEVQVLGIAAYEAIAAQGLFLALPPPPPQQQQLHLGRFTALHRIVVAVGADLTLPVLTAALSQLPALRRLHLKLNVSTYCRTNRLIADTESAAIRLNQAHVRKHRRALTPLPAITTLELQLDFKWHAHVPVLNLQTAFPGPLDMLVVDCAGQHSFPCTSCANDVFLFSQELTEVGRGRGEGGEGGPSTGTRSQTRAQMPKVMAMPPGAMSLKLLLSRKIAEKEICARRAVAALLPTVKDFHFERELF
ncbi:Ubiquitin protein ligase E3 component n-recognin 4 [Tyrophagus putrescentiae]|nr:Ubiquitin protein ligase E3 component n-recognin 4 [Tyrophagus putrescentiae]